MLGIPSPSSAIPWLRWLRISGHLLRGLAIVAFVYPQKSLAARQALRQQWCRQLLRQLGVRLQASGQPLATGQLLVANHISWLDVLVINAYTNTAFVAKDELLHWGPLGWLARKNDTIFLPRHTPGHARAINAQITAQLQAGHSVLVFPEGSTSEGRNVLPFHAALLQPAIDAQLPIQALALHYADALGRSSTAPAYAGDTSLWQSLCTMVATPYTLAQIGVCPALPTATAAKQGACNRRQLARRAHALIAARLQTQRGAAASLSRIRVEKGAWCVSPHPQYALPEAAL